MKKFKDKEDYDLMVEKDAYFKNRWGYLSKVISMMENINPKTILEIGANNFPLSNYSDTMDLIGNPTYKQSACEKWNIEKTYDLIIALQVFEHLDNPYLAFKECINHSNNILISLPYKWNCPGNCHHMIDEDTIFSWTNIEPFSSSIIDNKRIINYYKITEIYKKEIK